MAHYDDVREVKPRPEIPNLSEPQAIKSDGGSSSYYTVNVKNKNGETLTCETGDIIRALVANDFSLGNIIKACRRVSERTQGRGKQGTDPLYDLNKIKYFTQEIIDNVIR